MSVSLNQVQAAIQNLTPAGGVSGQLTLNVLHKTEALIGKLLALDTSKPLSVQILSATANGRAEVQVGALKLDVKASAPLKAGEVLRVKVEPYGATVRLVQADAPANGAVDRANGGANAGQNLTASAKVPGTPNSSGAQLNAGSLGGKSIAGNRAVVNGSVASTLSTPPSENIATAKVGATAVGQAVGQAVGAGGAVSGTPISGTPISAPAVVSANATGVAVAGSVSGALAGAPAQVSTGGVHGALPSALIGAMTEVLPVVLPTVLKKLGDRDTLKLNAKSGAEGSDGLAGGRGGAGNGTLANSAFDRMNAEQALAKYSKFAGSVEEIQETHSKHPQKAADMTLELPINAGDKPVLVHLHIGPEAQGDELAEDRTPYMVRFSLETEETGPVHAALGLYRSQVRVTIWAERAEFADILMEHQELLDERLAATGLNLGSVNIRKGHPITAHFKQQAHLDAQI